MALFDYFPNYVWNLSLAIALESGGKIGEIIDMCQPIRDAAASGADAGTPQFMAQWVAMAEQLIGLADEDAAGGRGYSASDKLERAVTWLRAEDDVRRRFLTEAGWAPDQAHRELEGPGGVRAKQVRLHTALA